MSPINAVVLGIVEGLTEFLPVSSTGHLEVAAALLGIPKSEATTSFLIFIQLGAILAVLTIYAKRFLSDIEVSRRVLLAFLPMAFVGLFLYDTIKEVLLGNLATVAYALIFGGVLMILSEWYISRKNESFEMDAMSAPLGTIFAIGLFQTLAVIPGVSRSGATIIGGLLLGLSRTSIVEFSFLLSLPTILGATTVDLLQSYQNISADLGPTFILGFTSAFIAASLSVRYFTRYIKNHTFVALGWYRIVAGLAVLWWM